MKTVLWSAALLLLLQSCTAAAFDKAQPAKGKRLAAFPKTFHGKWEASDSSGTFYVDRLEFSDSTVTYEMSELSPGNPAMLTLTPDSVELRTIKGGYTFAIAGDKLWLTYVVKMPSKNELFVYGFDADAKNYVKEYEEEDSEQGVVFIRYKATDSEWAKLLKSPALKVFRKFKRMRDF